MTEALTSVNTEMCVASAGAEIPINLKDSWLLEAACRYDDVHDFYTASIQRCDEAKEVCEGCPVKLSCLETALLTNERWGIWGGLTRVERLAVMRERGIKVVADIEDVDDEFDDDDEDDVVGTDSAVFDIGFDNVNTSTSDTSQTVAVVELSAVSRRRRKKRAARVLVDADVDDAQAFGGLNDPDEELARIEARKIADFNEATINAVFYGGFNPKDTVFGGFDIAEPVVPPLVDDATGESAQVTRVVSNDPWGPEPGVDLWDFVNPHVTPKAALRTHWGRHERR